MTEIRKILVVKFRNIGDVLLSTPLLENLRLCHPEAELHVAVNKMCEDMLSLNPHVDRIFAYDRQSVRSASAFLRIGMETRYFRNIVGHRYDLVVNLTEGDRGAWLCLLCVAPRRLGFFPRSFLLERLPAFTQGFQKTPHVHTVERDLSFLRLLGHEPKSRRVRIFWSDRTEEKVRRLLKKSGAVDFVHVHPVARWLFKCWDSKRFAQIVDWLENEMKLRVVVTASPDPLEIDRVEEIVSACRFTPLDLSGMLDLKEVACLSSHARFFLGVDTAPMHMAAAVNTPVVALFGHSDPVVWGPWDNDADRSFYRDVRSVQRNGRHMLVQKGHGELIVRNGRKISTAMMKIEVDDIKRAIEEVLSKNGPAAKFDPKS